MSTASQPNSRESIADPRTIVRELQENPYVKEVISLKAFDYTLVLALGPEAIDVLVDYLRDSGFLRINTGTTSTRTVFVSAPKADAERIRQEFSRAFRKVSQFLEYQELKKEYASGYVPRHLSEWLMEGGF
jgi:hypothetical protein